MEINNNNDILRKVCILNRHGSRAPSANAYKYFSSNPLVKLQWIRRSDNSLITESITSVGKEQTEEIGRTYKNWFSENGRYKNLKITDPKDIKWRSSVSNRVLQSAKYIFQEFGYHPELSNYEDEKEGDTTDNHIRQWQNREYNLFIKKLLSSSLYDEKAKEEITFLNELREIFNIPEAIDNKKLLFGSTYIKELYECELYMRENIKEEYDYNGKPEVQEDGSISNSALPVIDNVDFGDYTSQDLIHVLRNLLTKEHLEHIDELARWSWGERFFNQDISHLVGSNLLTEVFYDTFAQLQNGNGNDDDFNRLMIITAHDYTILSLLSALGYPRYPDIVISFASYLIIEFYESQNNDDNNNNNNDEGKYYALVRLNPTPFLQNHSEMTYSVIEENEYLLKNPFNDSYKWYFSNLQESCIVK